AVGETEDKVAAPPSPSGGSNDTNDDCCCCCCADAGGGSLPSGTAPDSPGAPPGGIVAAPFIPKPGEGPNIVPGPDLVGGRQPDIVPVAHHSQAPNAAAPAQPAQGGRQGPAVTYEKPTGFLRPGDLVIISGQYPGADEGASPFASKPEEYQARQATMKAKGPSYTVCGKRPRTIKELVNEINKAVQANKGPFRRIILVSHCGHHTD